MDNDVHRFNQNVRKGQWRPVDPDSMTGRAFSPATAKPSGGSGWMSRTFSGGKHHRASCKKPIVGRLAPCNRP